MNLLLEPLPRTVMIAGAEYDINSDFRTSVRFELLIQNRALSEMEQLLQGLFLYYPKTPVDVKEAIDRMIWFYQSGRDEPQSGRRRGKTAVQTYSYEYDDAYIYAAFMEQYGINLNSVEYLHWWEFKALFQSLNEETEMVKIMGYRSMTIDSKMSKEQKSFYKKMKERYKLPASREEREKLNEIEEALLNNHDVTGLL